MTLLRTDQFVGDMALDGVSYLVEWEDPNPFVVQATDTLLERAL